MVAPTLDSVRSAAERLRGIANRTPVLTSRTLNDRVGSEVFLKAECFQRTGSFKFRGAYNALSGIAAEEAARGVLTYSSGNHAQAVALAGKLLGIRVVVVMPAGAPVSKRDAAAAYGAEVVLHDPDRETREEVAARIQEERGSVLVPPFDQAAVIAGQGTAALELMEDAGPIDTLFAPCGGGGLLSGSALAARTVPGCRVIGIEPENADDAARTFRTGELHRVTNPPTIADGLRTPALGALTWPLIRENVADILTVSEGEIVEAMRFLWTRMKLVVEPSGATALAGMLKVDASFGGRIGVILSGGNVDLSVACGLLTPARDQGSAATR